MSPSQNSLRVVPMVSTFFQRALALGPILQVTLTRNNVAEGAKAEPVYAPKYPLFAEEGWWVLVGDLNRKIIFSFERIADSSHVVVKEVTLARSARF